MDAQQFLLTVCLALFLWAVGTTNVADASSAEPRDATAKTKEANAELLKRLPFHDKQDFDDASRGFIAKLKDPVIRDKQGKTVWDLERFSFTEPGKAAPDTVNPSLWRQCQLLWHAGLFKVTDRVYQVRSYDLSTITFVEGDTGIIVIDPLVSMETAKACLDLYYEHRPKKPVVAVIYSHSHVDHFGGVKGVVSEEDVSAGKVKIIAPEGFLKAALTENIIAGTAMGRRAGYMYGNLLPAGPKGQVGAGLGITTSSGTITIIPPTHTVTHTGQEMTVDGVTFVFQLVPDTEAPAEMHFYLPQFRALCTAENACHVLHNVYSLRGAKIRDALGWSKYLNEAIERWGDKSDVLFGVHHWPIWGQERIVTYLKKQRDVYRYIHDQTLRLANQGYTMVELAEMIELPEDLAGNWPTRGYYGSVNHDAKGVYVRYFGWFDGNPATLHPPPPQEASKKYVEFMGGPEKVLVQARAAYERGEYRWVAQVVNHVVFADPKNREARSLQADALEQLGYQAESGPWRNFYLSGAQELRKGVDKNAAVSTVSPDSIRAMPLDTFFDYLGVRLNGPKAAGKTITLNWNFTDTKEKYILSLENSVLNHTAKKQAERADATITLSRATFNEILLKQGSIGEKIASGDLTIEGNPEKVQELFSLLDTFDPWFNIVTP